MADEENSVSAALDRCILLLTTLADNPTLAASVDRDRLLALTKAAGRFSRPHKDIIDGAARVCDPFFDGILSGKHWCGKFLKDYRPTDW